MNVKQLLILVICTLTESLRPCGFMEPGWCSELFCLGTNLILLTFEILLANMIATLQMVTAHQPAIPHPSHDSVPDNEHCNLSRISTSTMTALTQAVASSLQMLLEDKLKVTCSCSYYQFLSTLIGLSQLLVMEDLKKWIDQHNVVVKSTNNFWSKEGVFKT